MSVAPRRAQSDSQLYPQEPRSAEALRPTDLVARRDVGPGAELAEVVRVLLFFPNAGVDSQDTPEYS